MSATWTWRAGIALALALSLAIPAFAGKGGGNGKPGGGGDPPSDPRVLFTTEGAIHVMNDDGTNQTRVLDTGEA